MINISDFPWNIHPQNPINSIPDDFNVCDDFSFRIMSRIGSASMNGRVYEVEQNSTGLRIALKFMSKENRHECILASRLGSSMPRFFPRVVSWAICPNVIVPNDDSFIEYVEREFMKSYVIENMIGTPLEIKRMRINLRGIYSNGPSLFREFKAMGVPHNILQDLQDYRGISMMVMASELMSGDLLSLIQETPEDKEIPRLIGEVFAGMRALVRHKVVHEDLHLGNILLRSDENGKKSSVIHDFGESTIDRSPYEHIRDIVKFLDALPKKYEDIVISSRVIVDNFQISKGDNITSNDMLNLLIKLQTHFK